MPGLEGGPDCLGNEFTCWGAEYWFRMGNDEGGLPVPCKGPASPGFAYGLFKFGCVEKLLGGAPLDVGGGPTWFELGIVGGAGGLAAYGPPIWVGGGPVRGPVGGPSCILALLAGGMGPWGGPL
jgi:hypothetical protein